MTRSENAGERRTRYTYADCLRGDFDPPASEGEGTLFQTLFVMGMATAMILFVNVAVHPATSFDPLALLASFPLWFCIAFTVRSLFANKLSFWLLDRLCGGRREGMGVSAVLVLVNVCIMAPVMCAVGVAMSGMPLGASVGAYATTLPLASAAAYAFCFLVVRPLVMLVFSNACKPLLARMRQAG